jgi:RHS repeat-associated protein
LQNLIEITKENQEVPIRDSLDLAVHKTVFLNFFGRGNFVDKLGTIKSALLERLVPKDFSHSGLSFFETFTRALRSLFEPSSPLSTMTKNSFGKILSIKDGAGVDIAANPVLRTSFTFTGREWDEESGLYYYRARSYSPEIGRFLQGDPDPGRLTNPSTINSKYIYALNRPGSLRDPMGASPFDDLLNFGHSFIADFGGLFDKLVKSDLMFAAVFVLSAIYATPVFLGALGGSLLQSSATGDWSFNTFKNEFYENLVLSAAFTYTFGGLGKDGWFTGSVGGGWTMNAATKGLGSTLFTGFMGSLKIFVG